MVEKYPGRASPIDYISAAEALARAGAAGAGNTFDERITQAIRGMSAQEAQIYFKSLASACKAVAINRKKID